MIFVVVVVVVEKNVIAHSFPCVKLVLHHHHYHHQQQQRWERNFLGGAMTQLVPKPTWSCLLIEWTLDSFSHSHGAATATANVVTERVGGGDPCEGGCAASFRE